MSGFFNAGGHAGWINLNHVVRITQHWSRADKETTTTFELADGTAYDTIRHLDPSAWSARFVPAAPGAVLLVACAFSTGEPHDRPTECHSHLEPVLAWAIPPDDAEEHWPSPVLLEPLANNERTFHLLPDGKYRAIAHRDYDSLDEVKQDVLAQAQAEWDREHATKAAQAAKEREPAG